MFKGLGLEAGVYKTTRNESKFSKDGKLFYTCSIPVDGEEKGEKVTVWVNCVAFGKTAEMLSNRLADKGRIDIHKWVLQTEGGLPPMYNEKPSWKAVIAACSIIDWKSLEGRPVESSGNAVPVFQVEDEEEFPF